MVQSFHHVALLALAICGSQSGGGGMPVFPLPHDYISQANSGARGESQQLALGSLGRSTILVQSNTAQDHTICGATGNCPISVVYRWHGRSHQQYLTYGWAYTVVRSTSSVPNIIIMANMSASSEQVTRFNFSKGRYVETGCDFVELRDDANSDILDPKSVNISSY